jgi:FkbM family methyltransferase
MTVHTYLLDWHINLSPAFHEIFINLIKGHTEVREVAWDGKSILPEWDKVNAEDVFVFCQKRPPAHVFAHQPKARVVWIPMWNNVQMMTASNWASIPKSIRILAYSPLISERSMAAGLETLLVRYAPDPDRFAATSWSQGNVLYYWNRVGMVSRQALIRLCAELNIRKVLFRPTLDPGIPQDRAYSLSTELEGIEVEKVPFFDTSADAGAFVSQANVVIAPRPSEGVGLAFLEAMAAGKAVLAVDRPTMSEYIEHGRTGILLKARTAWFNKRPMLSIAVSGRQNWQALRSMDLEAIGSNARTEIRALHQVWESDVAAIREFIFDWVSPTVRVQPSAGDPASPVQEGVAAPLALTEAKIGELHRLAPEAMAVQRLAPFFMKRLRSLREQVHPMYKQDLRVIKLRTGLTLEVNLGDHMGCDFYYGLFGEQQDFDLFMAAVKPGAVVVDVGANVGIYAISAAQRCGDAGRVLAFEPGPRARALLVGNVARNRLQRKVKVLAACTGHYDGVIEFDEAADSAMSSILSTSRGGRVQRLTCPIKTLDTSVAEEGIGKIDALKIDVEGAEWMVLAGAKHTLDESDPVIMLEISMKNLADEMLRHLRPALVELEERGFRMLRIMPFTFELKEFWHVGEIFEQPENVISGNYFLARAATGKFAELERLYQELAPVIRKPHRIFPGRPWSWWNRLERNRSIYWAERQKAEIAFDLIAELSRANDKD